MNTNTNKSGGTNAQTFTGALKTKLNELYSMNFLKEDKTIKSEFPLFNENSKIFLEEYLVVGISENLIKKLDSITNKKEDYDNTKKNIKSIIVFAISL